MSCSQFGKENSPEGKPPKISYPKPQNPPPFLISRQVTQLAALIAQPSAPVKGDIDGIAQGSHGGYKVQPQYQAGAYYIDLVVTGADGKRLAVECDGEQFHGFDQIQHDVERQAVLERMKWKFSRIRGSLYFRDEERAMAPVYTRLEELGIKPIAETELAAVPLDGVRVTLIREAQDIRRDWNEATES